LLVVALGVSGSEMRQKSNSSPGDVREVFRQYPTGDRRTSTAEEKIRIALDGPCGETSIAELFRREGIAELRMLKNA
jgi:transposase